MDKKIFIVEGRQFRTQAEQEKALKDAELIQKLRSRVKGFDESQMQKVIRDIRGGKYPFRTILGQDFADELEDGLLSGKNKKNDNRRVKDTSDAKDNNKASSPKTKNSKLKLSEEELAAYVQEELKRREKNRRLFLAFSSLMAILCLGYFGIYSYQDYRKNSEIDLYNELKNNDAMYDNIGSDGAVNTPFFTLDDKTTEKPVLEEYKNLLIKNKKLIGWLKIDDTNIDYPVVQTSDNEYYLDHNLNQEYDKNGTIFMDKDCDVLKPSTNYILYGHHMKSGQMFGKLDRYADEAYGKEHPYIEYDTIYEKGIYKVMYVFRSKVYSEEEVVFKYYQFIDALSETEFDSNMQEMAAVSLYDTGVTAKYGDRLLTLSTCDYQEKNGRFVVVAKKVTAKE